jgi:hypothetical protein
VHALHGQMDVIKSFMVDYFTGFTVQKSTKVQVKPLEGTQTFLGMIGYVLKVENQPSNFAGYVRSDDVTPAIILAAKKEFHRMRSDIMAGKVRIRAPAFFGHTAKPGFPLTS